MKAYRPSSDYLTDRIPRVHISADDEGVKEIELSDDPYDCMRLNVENVPCIVTLCKVSSRSQTHYNTNTDVLYIHTAFAPLTPPVLLQVGHRHIVDATLQEKACSVASLIMSVTHKGTVTCTRKVGGGSLDPESIFEMTEVSPALLRGHLASSRLS